MRCRIYLTLLLCGLAGCPARSPRATPAEKQLAQFHKLDPTIFSGAQPAGEVGFSALSELGVRTVISVDGARPDAPSARRHGIRTVHLPIGYGRIAPQRQLEIVRAIRDLPTPIYIHCHHGIHRGPTAAMLGLIALRGWSNTRAIAKMRQIGTSPNYGGLYKTVEEFTAPQAAQLDAADNSFPESSDVPPLAETMVLINQHVEALAKVRKVGWSRLTGHPDIDPPHEALQLRELFRELGRSEKKRPRPFRNWLSESENAATRLEKALRGNDRNSAGKAYGRLLSTCARCHGTYRAGRW